MLEAVLFSGGRAQGHEQLLIRREGPVPERLRAVLSEKKWPTLSPSPAAPSRAERDFFSWQRYFIKRLALTGKIYYGDPVTRWLQAVADRNLKSTQRSQSPLRVYTLAEASPNGFALPNGMVFIHLGLIDRLDTEGEMVFVLAHEYAHAERNHLYEAFAATTADKMRAGDAHHGLGWERYADSVALQQLTDAGFPVQEAINAIGKTYEPGSNQSLRDTRLNWLAGWAERAPLVPSKATLPIPPRVKEMTHASMGEVWLRSQAFSQLFEWGHGDTAIHARAPLAYASYLLTRYKWLGKWWDIAQDSFPNPGVFSPDMFELQPSVERILGIFASDTSFWTEVLTDLFAACPQRDPLSDSLWQACFPGQRYPEKQVWPEPTRLEVAMDNFPESNSRQALKGMRLGYQRLVAPSPFFDHFDSRSSSRNWEVLERGEENFQASLREAGDRLGMQVAVLDVVTRDSVHTYLNEDHIALLAWLEERWLRQELALVAWNEPACLRVCEQYGAEAILWTGVLATTQKRNLPPYHLGIGLVFPPYLPWAVYFSLAPEQRTLFDAELFAPGGRRPVMEYSRRMRIKEMGDLAPSFSYDLLMQIGHE